ncbi:IclR family transcriptional regulator [Pseudomonas sp. ZM23]|uniref:IclR family transcriptional regulator n=1 Tax=Pseudomonas triclosanedens TaxID=2961893 RepID=A0ABY7A4S8_9PSED|nr:IclR family transcriptional regulator [Pseudomonas triclosanedens]MCP8466357.1 IclR family transcriptional regulator [Pseudomonas triclosanedens]MCP8471883.1 IclR family transcriptional regulator [Pseudomonas triclosanedens]MCP8478578.1 IclR family transcriptional regulator [Pseudomonas triclosanedens]WAI52227.1 IclR family transcriptional regulator [Pseudomonas triclosanedens]
MNDAEDSAATKGKKVQSAEVGTEILKALADLAPSTSLKRLGEYLGMPAAKVHRYLQALIASGFAEQDPLTNHYGLGREALYVGLAAIRRLDVVKVASPALADLRDRLGQTCFLAIWGSHGPTVVQVEPAQGMVTLVTQVGSVLPLHGSSTGLVFAAFKDGLEEGAQSDVLENIRAEGLHAIHGLLMPGVNALSVPLFRTGRELAGVITVVGSQASFAAEPQGEAARALLETAREISLRMGGEADAAP